MDTSYNEKLIKLAEHIATWSKDPGAQVGAVVVDKLGRVIGIGYNGFPRGIADDYRLDHREEKLCMTVHAEINAILNSTHEPRGCILYCTHAPCSTCAAVIIQSGIKEVYYANGDLSARWEAQRKLALAMFDEAGVVACEMRQPGEDHEDDEIPF